MSDISSHPSVGVESVEWTDAGGDSITVRVVGRWRRRRGWLHPETRGPMVLVVEVAGDRHRFAALPEPPSLAGAAPGSWRLSFTIPARLVPGPDGRAWLSLGGDVTVPLPVTDARSSGEEDRTAAEPSPPSVSSAATGPAPAPSTPVPAPSTPVPAPSTPLPAPSTSVPAGPTPVPADGPPASEPPRVPSAPAPLGIERAWRRAEAAERASASLAARITELEHELTALRDERAADAATLADRERRRREAEQRAHAEQAMRQELTRELAAGAERSTDVRRAMGELAAAEERIRDLEVQLDAAWRAGEEAEHTAAAAHAGRIRAERILATTASRPPAASPAPAELGEGDPGPEREWLALEDALRSRRAASAPGGRTGGVRIPAEPPQVPDPPVAVPVVALSETETVAALRHELDARAAAEAGLRARLVQAETRLAARVLLEQRTGATLRDLRTELDGLREALGAEREARAAAEAQAQRLREALDGRRDRSRDASAAIGELRGALERLAPGRVDPLAPAGDGPEPAVPVTDPTSATPSVSPEALNDALARLRQAREPRDEVAPADDPSPLPVPAGDGLAPRTAPTAAMAALALAAAARPTLAATLRRLAARDAGQAGRVIVDLVGAQRAAHPRPIAYDLVLGPGHGCVQVTLGESETTIVHAGAARSREQVDLQLRGDPARLARRLLAGRLRSLAPLGLARVRGRRDGLAAPRALLDLPLDLVALSDAGMRPGAESVLALVAGMIEPTWTAGERFTVAHVDEHGVATHLEVRDGAAPRVSRTAGPGRVATTLTGSAAALPGALATRAPAPGLVVSGDAGPLELVREWVNRAQCG